MNTTADAVADPPTALPTLSPTLAHVARAVDTELVTPRVADGRAEAAAMAVASTLAFITASQVVPVGGPVVVAATLAAFAPTLRRTREEIELSLDEARACRRPVPEQVQHALDAETSARVLPGQPEDERVKAWQAWLPWSELRAGEHVPVPAELPHPSCAGFDFTRLAARCGQACDWVASLPDGSRLHVHEYPDGRQEVHRDMLDPRQGPATAVIHYLSEAREGQALFGALALGALIGGIALADRGVL